MDEAKNEVLGVLVPFRRRREKKYEKVYINDKRPEAGYIPHLLRRNDNGVYYVRKKKTGKKDLFESLGTDSKGQAKAWAERRVAEYLGGIYVPDSQRARTPLIEDIVNEHLVVLEQMARNGSDERRLATTFENDKQWAKRVKRHFGHIRVDQFSTKAWAEWYRDEFPACGLKSLDDIAKHLSKTLTFAVERGYIGAKPKISNFQRKGRKATPKSRAYQPEEVKRVAGACLTLEEQLKFALHMESGMRSGEVRGLLWDYVKKKCEGIEIALPAIFEKRKKERAFFVSPRVEHLLNEQRKLTGKTPFVFPSKRKLGRPETRKAYNEKWQRVFQRAKVSGIPYWFRHTFYTATILDAKLPVALVSDYAGTSMATIEKHYIHGDSSKTREVAVSMCDKWVTLEYGNAQVPKKKKKKV